MIAATVKVIAFDADDTLWVNEPLFRKAEERFCSLMEDFLPTEQSERLLYEMEMRNLGIYGYGIKPFTLSLIEAAIEFSNGKVPNTIIQELIRQGKQMLEEPVTVIDGIEKVLQDLSKKYRLVVATKGDLLDQERKLIKSGLSHYFHHIEVMSDKTEQHYKRLIQHLDSTPEEFLMIGNSLKSDIVPVLNIGAYAIHVPFHTTWIHEMVDEEVIHPNFKSIHKATELYS